MASHRKTHLGGPAEPCTNFIQLQVRNVQVAEAALMEDLSMLACPSEPGGDGGPTVAEDPLGRRGVQPFCQRRQYHGDLGRGSFQTVQRSVASSTERRAAS